MQQIDDLNTVDTVQNHTQNQTLEVTFSRDIEQAEVIALYQANEWSSAQVLKSLFPLYFIPTVW
ncbi:hypothetical protein JCM19237_6122 [Photobacterium aphoticum]|uniref:Uncharacterized protein n=1 Tax=Photobacterium aphoticum TaxID=754436 RepID=A0A090QN30_9GAMM|nr:hypothetical protein JCM19237_6122 [Photobacterium aphoticum]